MASYRGNQRRIGRRVYDWRDHITTPQAPQQSKVAMEPGLSSMMDDLAASKDGIHDIPRTEVTPVETATPDEAEGKVGKGISGRGYTKAKAVGGNFDWDDRFGAAYQPFDEATSGFGIGKTIKVKHAPTRQIKKHTPVAAKANRGRKKII